MYRPGYPQTSVAEFLIVVDQTVLTGQDHALFSPRLRRLNQVIHQISRDSLPPVFRNHVEPENALIHPVDGMYQSIFGLDVIPEYRRQGVAADLMNHLIQTAKARGKKGMILTCKDRLIHYYEKFGYRSLGISGSVHGGAVWYDMLLEF